jgi:D-glutamate N-acetyltransferase
MHCASSREAARACRPEKPRTSGGHGFTAVPAARLIYRMPRHLIYAQDQFGTPASKTAHSVVRYSPHHVAAILDPRYAGRTVRDVVGFGGDIPIVGSVADGVARGANSFLVGIAVAGGGLPSELRAALRLAIEDGLEIWNGLHGFVSEDPELGPLAHARGVTVHDVRRPPDALLVGAGRVRTLEQTILLAVGTDANIGKMTVMLQLRDALSMRNVRARFAPTGQTGIFIEGWGICVDAVVADFISGAAEQVTLEAARGADIVFVEGQGSILHPGYSGVSLGLLHGSMPHGLIACHQPSRKTFRHNPWLEIPPLTDVIALHESIAEPLRPARTIGVSLNTADLSDHEARATIERTSEETGLPTTDPVRFDPAPLVEAVLAFHRDRHAERLHRPAEVS